MQSRAPFRLLTLALFVALSLGTQPAFSRPANPLEPQASSTTPAVTLTELSVGFQNAGRVGSWLPIRLKAHGLPTNTTLSLVVTAPDPRGDLCESLVANATADSSGSVTFTGVFAVGRLDGRVTLSLRNEAAVTVWEQSLLCEATSSPEPESPAPTAAPSVAAETTTTTTTAIADSAPGVTLPRRLQLLRHAPLTVLTTGQPAGLTELRQRLQSSPGTQDALVLLNLNSTAQLPTQSRALDSLDTILLVSEFQMTPAQADALRDWVLSGGHLIVSCGSAAPDLLASPLGAWIQPLFEIPADNSTRETLDLTPVQNFVIGATALQTNRNPVTVMRLPSFQPKVLVQSLNEPLISRAAAGAGLITAVGIDLNSRPLDQWLSLSQLHETLLFGRLLDATTGQGRVGSRIASVGVNDLSTQLAAVSDAIPPEQRWSTGQIMLMMLALILLVGPLDYFLVVRTLRTPRLTWLTFPLLLALACGGTWLASDSSRGPQTVRQVSLLDVCQDQQNQALRARTWSSLSTTATQVATISSGDHPWLAQLPVTSNDHVLAWSGRAEDIYGGMYRPGGVGLGQYQSRRQDPAPSGFNAVPLLADGSTAFLNEVRQRVTGTPVFQSELTLPPSALLEGTFTHQLPSAIRDWIVVCGNRVYAPSDRASEDERTLLPGEVWSRQQGNVRVSEIRDFLRGVRLLENSKTPEGTNPLQSKVTQTQTPWDINSRNPLEILLMTSLYQSAGGEVFVQLQNDQLRRDEVSDTIVLNSALLIGSIDLPLSTLRLNDQETTPEASETVVRLFLPIRRLPRIGSDQANPKE